MADHRDRPALRVGFIGLGSMGLPMTRHIGDAGYALVVHDVVDQAVQAAAAAGAGVASTPAELAASTDVVFVMTAYEDQVVDVLTGASGVLSGAAEGRPVVVVSSTITPEVASDLAAECARHGTAMLDAPVCRGVQGAREANLLWLVGGDRDVLATVAPVMKACGQDVHHLGAPGAGMVGKALNNLLLWSCLVANNEAFRIGAEYGLDQADLIRALQHSSGGNWLLDHWDQTTNVPWALKDLQALLEMGDERGMSLPFTSLLREQVKLYSPGLKIPSHRRP